MEHISWILKTAQQPPDHQTRFSKRLPLNNISTGEIKELLPQLKIKANVVHAGLSQPLDLLKDSGLCIPSNHLPHYQNNNSWTAQLPMETMVAAEGFHHKPSLILLMLVDLKLN